METNDTCQIGELATKSGLTRDALRYYERLGLLPPTRRTSGGFRVYPAVTLDRLRFIKQAQRLGLTLHEIGTLVSYQDQGGLRRCRQVRDLLRLKLDELMVKLTELEEFRNTLSGHLKECERTLSVGAKADTQAEPGCPVIEDPRSKRVRMAD